MRIEIKKHIFTNNIYHIHIVYIYIIEERSSTTV